MFSINNVSNFQETFENITSLRYSFDESEFDSVSASARDFISFLLVLDQYERPTATQTLNHAWLTNHEGDDTSAAAVNKRRLGNFVVARQRWQKCTNVIMVCNSLQQGAGASEGAAKSWSDKHRS